MALAHQFEMAYAFFVLFGFWGLGHWLSSEFLRKKVANLARREVRRNPHRYRREVFLYRTWQLTGSLLALVIAIIFIAWTRGIKSDITNAYLKQERDQVYDLLRVEPQPLPDSGVLRDIDVAITNGAHQDVGEHVVSCVLHGVVSSQANGAVNGWMAMPQIFSMGLLGGERGETIACKSEISMVAPIVCADMSVSVSFSVAGQTTIPLRKDYRFRFDSNKEKQWVQQSLTVRTDYCDAVLTTMLKSETRKSH